MNCKYDDSMEDDHSGQPATRPKPNPSTPGVECPEESLQAIGFFSCNKGSGMNSKAGPSLGFIDSFDSWSKYDELIYTIMSLLSKCT